MIDIHLSGALAVLFHMTIVEFKLPTFLPEFWIHEMTSLYQSLRRLTRNYGFSLLVIATVCLALGVNFGLVSVTQSVLTGTLGVPDAGSLVGYTMELGHGFRNAPFSGPAYDSFRHYGNRESLFGWDVIQVRVGEPGHSVHVTGALVTGNAFKTLGLVAILGRLLNDADDAPGGGATGWSAVISYEYWRQHYGSQEQVIGKILDVNGEPTQIVGVLPRGFHGLTPPLEANIILSRRFLDVSNSGENRDSTPGYFDWYLFDRLRTGESLQQLRIAAVKAEPSLRAEADPKHFVFTSAPRGSLIRVETAENGNSHILQLFRVPLLAMLILGAVLFALCWINLLFLFIDKVNRESGANAVRTALGASIGSLIQLACFDASLLSLVGACLSWPIARFIAGRLSQMVQSIPGLDSFPTASPNLSVLVAICIAATLTANTSAVASLFWYGTKQPNSLLGGRTKSAERLLISFLIGLEVFLGSLLVVVALVSVIGFHVISQEQSGFNDSAVVANLDFGAVSDPVVGNRRIRGILETLRAFPGVLHVASMSTPPLLGTTSNATYGALRSDGKVAIDKGMWPVTVTWDYFNAVGTPLPLGRGFTLSDFDGSTVCVVSAAASRTLFGNDSPIGQTVYQGQGSSDDKLGKPSCTVIGVAGDAHLQSMSEQPERAVYFLTDRPVANIVVSATDASVAKAAIERVVAQSSGVTLSSSADSISELRSNNLKIGLLLAQFTVVCAVITGLILVVGIFGIVALDAAKQKKANAIRLALGATNGEIWVRLCRRLMTPVGFGLGLASAILLTVSHPLASLFQLERISIVAIFAIGMAGVMGIVIAAVILPCIRAVSSDFYNSLRVD